MQRATAFLWTVIVVLFQLVLVAVLVSLILGDAAGPVVTSIYENTVTLFLSLNAAAVAVAGVLLFFWLLYTGRLARRIRPIEPAE
jgi:hypothetical protein